MYVVSRVSICDIKASRVQLSVGTGSKSTLNRSWENKVINSSSVYLHFFLLEQVDRDLKKKKSPFNPDLVFSW